MRAKPQNKHDQNNTPSEAENLRLEEIVNHSPAIAFVWHVAEGWPVAFVSDNIRQFGYTPQDFYSKKVSYASIIHPDDLERISTEVKNHTRRKDAEFTQEYRIITRDEQIRWVYDRTYVKRDKEGRLTYLEGIVLDITQRKQAEDALRESEEKFRSIVENSLAGIFKVNDSYHFVYANDELCRILGYPLEELIGMNFQDGLAEESRAIVVDRYIRRQRGEQVPSRYELKIKRKNGELRDAEMIVSVVKDSTGKPSTMGQLVDITERKQADNSLRESEEKFRSIVENSLAGIFKVDDSFHFVYVNDEFCRILDYPKNELIGRNFQEYLSDESRNQVVDRYVRRQRGEVVPPRYEIKIKQRNNVERDIEMIVSVVKDSTGKPSTMGQIVDITERKHAEDVIRASELRLSEALSVARMGHWEYDVPNGLFTFNDQYYGLHKTTSEVCGGYQMAAEHFASHYVFPEDAHFIPEMIADATETVISNYQKQLELRIICADGELRWVVIWFRVEKDKDGRTIKLHGVSQDIHDRKLAEQKEHHHAARAEALARIATQISRQMDLDITLSAVCEETAHVLNTQIAVIAMVDPLFPKVNTISGYGLPSDFNKDDLTVPLSIFKEGLKLYPDSALVFQDYQAEDGIPMDSLMSKYDIQTIALTSIKWQTKLIGALVVMSAGKTRQYDDDELSLLQSLADESAQAIMNSRYLEDARRRLERLEVLRTIDNAIASSLDLRHTLSVFLDQLRNQLKVDAADILLLNPHSFTYDYAYDIGMHTDTLKKFTVHLNNDPVGNIVLNRQRVQISDLQQYSDLTRSKAFMVEGFASYYGIPLITKGEVRGVLEIFHRKPVTFDKEWTDFLESLAGQAAISIDNAALFDDLQRSNMELTLAYDATIEGWSYALDLRDEGTKGHTQRVAQLTVRLAKEMGINDDELIHFRRGAILHDIGKMGIPDEILHKPGNLDEEEMEIMRKHPGYAYEMLSSIRYLKTSLDIPYCHHEKWDGTRVPAWA